MSEREGRIWRALLRIFGAAFAVWCVAFILLKTLADHPALLYAALVGLALAVLGAAFLRYRRKRTRPVREELQRVSKTTWKRG